MAGLRDGFGMGVGLVLGIFVVLTVLPLLAVGGCLLMGGLATSLAIRAEHDKVTTGKVIEVEPQNNQAIAPTLIVGDQPPIDITELPTVDVAEPIDEMEATHADQARQQPRQWTDDTGQFSVTAILIDVADGQVILQKEDGQRVTVPLDRLSAGDRQHIERMKKPGHP